MGQLHWRRPSRGGAPTGGCPNPRPVSSSILTSYSHTIGLPGRQGEQIIQSAFPDHVCRAARQPSDPEEPTATFRMRSNKASQSPLLPEQDAYFHLLVLLRLLDSNRNKEAVTCSGRP